jgi:hypothetical protein
MANPATSVPAKGPLTLGLSWPLLVGVLTWIGMLTLRTPRALLSDPGIHWHPATGRWILEHGRIPTGDPFSYSMPDAPWIVQAWLSEVIFAAAQAAGGWSAMAALAAVCFAVTLALMTRFLVQRMEPVHALLIVVLSTGLMTSHLIARPHVLTWPLMALWVGSLVSASEAQRPPPMWLLVVMALWANLHGGFTLGLALAAAIGLDAVVARPAAQRWRVAGQWSVFLALATLASMATPYGWRGLWFTFGLLQQTYSLSVINEWQSPNMRTLIGAQIWLLVMLGLAWSGRVRLPLLRLLTVLGLIHMALTSSRSLSLLGLVAPYLMAAPMARQWYASEPRSGAGDAASLDEWFRAMAAPARPAAAITAAVLAAGVGAAILRANPPEPLPQVSPVAAMQAARAAGVQGKVLNDVAFGGYLIAQGVPVFIDDRVDMYGDAHLKRFVDATGLADPKALAELLDQHEIGWTIFPTWIAVNSMLSATPGWRHVFSDEYAVVYMREKNDAPR